MSHEFETGLFVSEPAWHGLGVVLDKAPGVNEALTLAGLDWEVNAMPLLTADGRKITTHRAMMRSSDKSILGVVGNDFTPLQNKDAFAWFQPLVESGEVTIEAAGSLKKGRRVWILAAIKSGTADVKKGDAVKQYVLVAHGHDGSLSLRTGITLVRVVCQNTLTMAIFNASESEKEKLVTLRHTSGIKMNLEKVRERLDMQRGKLKDQVTVYRELARRGIDEKNLVRYVREVLSPGAADNEKKRVPHVDKVVELFESGRGADMTRGTLWGAFNAVTEHVTHHRGVNQDSRQNANWFGYGPQLMQRALNVAVQFAEDAPLAEQSRAAYSNHATAKAELDNLLARPRAAAPAAAPAPETPAPTGDLAALLAKPRRQASDDTAA